MPQIYGTSGSRRAPAIVAAGVLSGDLLDATGGAADYHTTAMVTSSTAGHESSARGGNHVFYNSVR